jgi:hypothetical protein
MGASLPTRSSTSPRASSTLLVHELDEVKAELANLKMMVQGLGFAGGVGCARQPRDHRPVAQHDVHRDADRRADRHRQERSSDRPAWDGRFAGEPVVTVKEADDSDRPITTESVVIDGAGGSSALVRKVYMPPLDGRSDDYEGFDMRIAKGIGELLNKHYFGYAWKTYADTQQGVVGFAIPELMGETLHMVINLKQFSDLTPDLDRPQGRRAARAHAPAARQVRHGRAAVAARRTSQVPLRR